MSPAPTRTLPSIFQCPKCGTCVRAVQYIKSGMVVGLHCQRCDWTWTRETALDKARADRALAELTGTLTPP